ncbi:hypothetical protein L484_008630 [Morus notabilis]|uniref:Uncharacterized protein n=1 Tax=Morus notabilis TaxID=981085 RepID=W9SIJ6_9ROSA|nr:hypothetical protein L484_008630 [Morus notabilis]
MYVWLQFLRRNEMNVTKISLNERNETWEGERDLSANYSGSIGERSTTAREGVNFAASLDH